MKTRDQRSDMSRHLKEGSVPQKKNCLTAVFTQRQAVPVEIFSIKMITRPFHVSLDDIWN